MSFVYGNFLIPVLLIAIGICYLFWIKEKKVANWVKNYWFYTISKSSKWALIFFSLGVTMLSLSLLDLRGPSENIKAEIPVQRTLILIDVSLSMMAEDIRPNRLFKAIQVAKHFVRKAAGHSISVNIFSDNSKQLIPFSKDIDLIDARLNALKDYNIGRGGSNIRKAIQESVQSFRAFYKDPSKTKGNILILSDSEETASDWELDLPDGVTIAYVAVGTRKGARIPIRGKTGDLQGYKKFNNSEVVSKLDEAELKKLADKIGNFKYWVLTSYSIPTEELLSYFSKLHNDKYAMADTIIRPVLMEYIVVPAILLIIISFILRLKKSYIIPVLLIFFNIESFANTQDAKEVDIKTLPLYKKFKAGKANKLEKLRLAQTYLEAKKPKKANSIYEENLNVLEDLNTYELQGALMNYGTSLIQTGEISKALKILQALKSVVKDEGLKKQINENILALLKQQEQKKQQQKQDNKDSKDSKDNKGSGKESESDKKENQKDKDQDQSNDKQDKKNKKDEREDKDKKKEEDKQQSPQEKLARKKKLPAMLKQLIEKDRKLQEKLLDTKTQGQGRQGRKDW